MIYETQRAHYKNKILVIFYRVWLCYEKKNKKQKKNKKLLHYYCYYSEIVSCQLNFSAFATTIFAPQISDVVYMIHSNESEKAYSFGLSTIKSF